MVRRSTTTTEAQPLFSACPVRRKLDYARAWAKTSVGPKAGLALVAPGLELLGYCGEVPELGIHRVLFAKTAFEAPAHG